MRVVALHELTGERGELHTDGSESQHLRVLLNAWGSENLLRSVGSSQHRLDRGGEELIVLDHGRQQTFIGGRAADIDSFATSVEQLIGPEEMTDRGGGRWLQDA